MRLLIVGDFACTSGFARVNEALAVRLCALGWDIAVLSVNDDGDPHALRRLFRLYPAINGGDSMGYQRIADLVAQEQPDVILIVNDPWAVSSYLRRLPESAPPVVAYMPIDACGLRWRHVEPLNRLTHAVAYTHFGLSQLRAAGLDVEASIVPHGIDLDLFTPVSQAEARAATGLPLDTFAVLVLDRNATRKRLDIAFDAFARFAQDKSESVKLVYHGSLADESRTGWAIEDMAIDLGIADRLVLTKRDMGPLRGLAADQLKIIYSMCDVKLSTSSGEGWGLATMEAMACGVPCVAPKNAAYAEWASEAALLITASIPTRHAGGINTVGSVPLAEDIRDALDDLYWHEQIRDELRGRGLDLVQQERFRWEVIARQFDLALRQAVEQGVAV